MEKNKTQTLVLISVLLMGMLSCKKEEQDINHKGIVFHNSLLRVLQTGISTQNFYFGRGDIYYYGGEFFRGARLQNGVLRIPCFVDTTRMNTGGAIEYSFAGKTVNEIRTQSYDSNHVIDLLPLGSNRYVAYAENMIKDTLKGVKLTILDENFQPLSQKYFTNLRRTIFFEKLPGGNFIMHITWDYTKSWFYCFDQNLNKVWESQPIDIKAVYFSVGTSSMVIADESKLTQFDLAGNIINTYSLASSHLIHSITALPDGGFLALGSYSRADKYDVLFAERFDKDLKPQKSNLIETPAFSPNPNLKFTIRSNTIVDNKGYYFVVNMRNPANAFGLDPEEAKLVKMSPDLNIDFVKSVDTRRRKDADQTYLAKYNEQLLCMGPSMWNGQKGFSFIRMDMNGNIVE